MQTITSQAIDISLSQKKELIKGLEQGNDLKVTVRHLKELIIGFKETIIQDSLMIVDKNKIISLLESVNKDSKLLIKKEEEVSIKEKAILLDNFKRRLSFGVSIGATLKDFESFTIVPYVGIGVNIRIFRF